MEIFYKLLENFFSNFIIGGVYIKCPDCGIENQEEAKFCESCGRKLNSIPTEEKNVEEPPTYLIVLGYVLGILGIFSLGILSIIGLVIGLVIYKKGPKGKTHGLIIIIVSLAIIILIILSFLALIIYRAYFY